MNSKDLPKCPIETTLKMLGCKWKVLIIRELLTGTKRFCELKKSVKGITQKVLTSKLRELEDLELLERKVYEQTPPKVEYTLTDVGYSLSSVLDGMRAWGKDYKKYIKLVEKHKMG
jgi:DNA-binding HxlR family transcriptional regulator